MRSLRGLTMPKWGLAMTEGKVVRWLVDEGTAVSPSLELAEIETDKILGSLEASGIGILLRKVAREDDVVPVGGLLGIIGDTSHTVEQIDSFISDYQARFVLQKADNVASLPLYEVVTVMGQPIRYFKRGESEEAVILIHGFGGDLNSWLFNQEFLAQRRAVYSLDLPGHGGSSKEVGNGTVSEFARVLNAFTDAIGLSRFHLVGHSMGGAVGSEFAFSHPERCRSLVLVASAGLGPDINGEFVDGFIAGSRRKEIKPHLEKLFADERLIGRQLVEDVLKYKRLDGVELALRKIADQFSRRVGKPWCCVIGLASLRCQQWSYGEPKTVSCRFRTLRAFRKALELKSSPEADTWCTWRPLWQLMNCFIHSGNPHQEKTIVTAREVLA